MAISSKTLEILGRTLEQDSLGVYPDRQATPLSDGTYPIRDTGSTYRIDDEVPTTTKDMNKLFEWEYGDEIYGSQAKDAKDVKTYRRDIESAWGKEDDYKDIYIDTITGKVLVSKQLDKWK